MKAQLNRPEDKNMASNKAGYDMEYAKKNLKRIPLNIRKSFYSEVLVKAAEQSGMSTNGFIKTAIQEKIARDGLDLPDIKP